MNEAAIIFRNSDATSDGYSDVGIAGPLTHATVPTLRQHLRFIVERSPSHVLRLDLSCCTNINIDGMFALQAERDAARDRGGDLQLAHVPPLIERQLRQHNFDGLLERTEGGPR